MVFASFADKLLDLEPRSFWKLVSLVKTYLTCSIDESLFLWAAGQVVLLALWIQSEIDFLSQWKHIQCVAAMNKTVQDSEDTV